MASRYAPALLRRIRNEIPIDQVITRLLQLELRNVRRILRFHCPLCCSFHTATHQKTNLARGFDCRKNFNPIYMVMTVGKCSFILDAVEFLKKSIS
jgi:hypothetical protein